MDLRRQLADIYRQIGNAAEAGRWSYLDEGSDPLEDLAFEKAYPSAAARRAALRWPNDALAPTDFVRRRLAELPDPEPVVEKGHWLKQLGWQRLSAFAVLGALALVGLYAVVEWFLS